MLISWALALGGIALLFGGGEALVRGAVALASRIGVPPLVIGLTVVGFGTSAPELVVSVGAALQGQDDLAIGNIVGSNIANILLILGLSAVISPLAVQEQVFRRDGVVMVAASLALAGLALLGAIDRWAGALLVVGLAVFVVAAYVSGRREEAQARAYAAEAEELKDVPLSGRAATLASVTGLILLVIGARMLVTGAVDLAHSFGVPEAVIGLTLVAVGTSLPELAVSLIAAVRGHSDVAVGNVVGSNIFNILGIIGVAALVSPLSFGGRMASIDVWVMVAVAAASMVLLRTGWRLSRWEGIACLIAYGVYSASMFAA